MLTKDLLRVSRRGGGYQPVFAGRDQRPLAARVLGTYQGHVGERRSDLDAALGDLEGDAEDFKLVRGFAKLCERESTFETRAPVTPASARRSAFVAAEAVGGVVSSDERERALARAADSLAVPVEDVDASLFADLDENTLDSNDDDTDIRAQTASTSQTGSATSPSTSGATPATASTDRAEPDRRSADIAALAASANVDWDVDESLQSDAPDGSDLDAVFEGLERDAAMSTFAGSTTTDDDQVTSTDLLSVVDDETIDADDEFDWLDASELERAPDAIADAAAIDLDPKAPRST